MFGKLISYFKHLALHCNQLISVSSKEIKISIVIKRIFSFEIKFSINVFKWFTIAEILYTCSVLIR